MVDFSGIMHADLGKLKAAADEWHLLPKKYQGLAESFDGRVTNPLKNDWEGKAAEQAQAALGKLRKQYEAAAEEAGALGRLLRDAHTEFLTIQKQLRRLMEEDAPADKLKVSDAGTVVDVDPGRSAGRNADPDHTYLKERGEKIDALQGRIDAVVKRATVADEALNYALRKDANGAKNLGFNTKVPTSIDAAEADQALALTKRGDKLTDKQLSQLNRILEVNEHDKEFSKRLAVGMGPKGSLEFWTQLADVRQTSDAHIKHLEHLQKSLGTTLATATTAPGMDEWKKDLLALGSQRIDPTHGMDHRSLSHPYGYQVISSLMQNGKYDSKFLQTYGKELIAFEKKHGDPNHLWRPNGSGAQLSFGGDDNGNDPMAGYMDALGHNPDAATKFFHSNDPGEDADLKYLTKDRKWLHDPALDGDKDSGKGYVELGHALEAATLGSPFDADPPALHRSKESAEVMAQVMEVYRRNSDYGGGYSLLEDQPGMEESLAKMGAGYIDDFNRAVANIGDTGPQLGTEDIFPRSYERPGYGFSSSEVMGFMDTLGRNEDSHGVMTKAQQVYMSGQLESSNGHGLYTIARAGGTVHGVLDEARLNQIDADFSEKKEDIEKEYAKSGDWKSTGVGAAVGFGVSLIPAPGAQAAGAAVVPIATDVAQEVIGTYMEHSIGDGEDSAAEQAVEKIKREGSISKEQYTDLGEARLMRPIKAYEERHGMSQEEFERIIGYAHGAYNDGKVGSESRGIS
ncbi:WXG100 family type VII secretion target [Streptomyces sp. WAC01526]|uniref:WXG100 family type VII secretion target n=1 Tax=Streptomyces sp. WAC01526 TaxID=2588709 RepID=UPI0011DF6E16|nr:DUF6571 family protein [Streptomyces sp. WAC01526]